MKAEELAQWLNDESQDNPDDPKWQAAAELRRQSSEIERLEARCASLELAMARLIASHADYTQSQKQGWPELPRGYPDLDWSMEIEESTRALLEKSNG